MRRSGSVFIAVMLAGGLAGFTTGDAASGPVAAAAVDQRGGHRRPPPVRPAWRPSRSGVFVFIGGYFYDPFYGPYPWWPHPAYPYWYRPIYDDRAEVRVVCPERRAAVYVDGFYAGIVDDFDGSFQRLPLPPGGHRIALYLAGYATEEFSVYLQPGATFTLRHEMVRLGPGEVSRAPVVSPPVPPPPQGTYSEPRGTPPLQPTTPAAVTPAVAHGAVEIRVQPVTARLLIDGEPWLTSEPGHFDVELPIGRHRIEVQAPGYRPFTDDIDVREGAETPVNVSLVRVPT